MYSLKLSRAPDSLAKLTERLQKAKRLPGYLAPAIRTGESHALPVSLRSNIGKPNEVFSTQVILDTLRLACQSQIRINAEPYKPLRPDKISVVRARDVFLSESDLSDELKKIEVDLKVANFFDGFFGGLSGWYAEFEEYEALSGSRFDGEDIDFFTALSELDLQRLARNNPTACVLLATLSLDDARDEFLESAQGQERLAFLRSLVSASDFDVSHLIRCFEYFSQREPELRFPSRMRRELGNALVYAASCGNAQAREYLSQNDLTDYLMYDWRAMGYSERGHYLSFFVAIPAGMYEPLCWLAGTHPERLEEFNRSTVFVRHRSGLPEFVIP